MLDAVIFVSQMTAIFALGLLELAFLARMIVSLFEDPTKGSPIGNLLYVITEPFVMPFRLLFEKLNWFQNTPMDMAYVFTSLFVLLLSSLFTSIFL